MSPLVILPVASVLATGMLIKAYGSPRDPLIGYFPDPQKPWEYVQLVAIYALPTSWLAMIFAVPLFLYASARGIATLWLAAIAGVAAGLLAALVLSAPAYDWLLSEGIVFGLAVGVTFWGVERALWNRRPKTGA